MLLKGKHSKTIWLREDGYIEVYDQRFFPFDYKTEILKTHLDVYYCIEEMHVRGAPLIGVTGAFGVYLGILEHNGECDFNTITIIADKIKSSRPTAINLEYSVDRVVSLLKNINNPIERVNISKHEALNILKEEEDFSYKIGLYGVELIREISKRKNGEVVNILTHCNAGWLACIDYGTATAPIYQAHKEGIPIHVWVDETRPRNQGARLTAFELSEQGIDHSLIVDNLGGHLMQHNMVDMVIVGSDRTTYTGDVANKIGTYLKALAAHDNNIPFYVALPSSTIDWSISDGIRQIPIEMRSQEEVRIMDGIDSKGIINEIRICPENTKAINYGFDVTPSKYVTALITEKGICKANESDIKFLFNKN